MSAKKTKSRVGIGIIGCGGRLRGLAQALLQEIPAGRNLDLVGLCDPDARAIKQARKQLNSPATAFKDYRELVNDPAVDWVMIGSWNCHHREHAVAAFRAGKHVYCEKPLATTLEDCLAMQRAQAKAGTMFNIGFTLRYSPHYRRIRNLLQDGAVGDILSMEFNETLHFNHGGYIHGDWRRKTQWAGSHLLEKCCHDIDLANWMVGSIARRVASFGGCDFFVPSNKMYQKRLGPDPRSGRPAFQTWISPVGVNPFTKDKDVIDNQVAIIEYANGVRATFHTNCCAAIPERRMYICGTEGAIRADVIRGTIEHQAIGWDSKLRNVSTGARGGHGGGDMILLKELADSMLKGKPPFSTLEDGLKSAVTSFGIDRAMDSGKVVDMAPLWKKVGIDLAAAGKMVRPAD